VVPGQVGVGEDVEIAARVRNTGSRAGDEVVQVYVTDGEAGAPVPIRSLAGARRVHLAAGEARTVRFSLTPRQLSLIDARGARVVEPGVFEVSVGGKQPGFRGVADAATTGVVTGRFEVVGAPLRLPR